MNEHSPSGPGILDIGPNKDTMSGTTFSKLPVMIVALVIGLILTFTAVMPLVSDYSDAKTFTNEGYFRMTEIKEDTNVTIEWDHTKPTSFFINDAEYPINVEVSRLVSIVGTDGMLIRYVASTDGSANRVQAYSSAGFVQAAVTSGTDMLIELTNDSISVTVGETTKTVTITEGYYIDPNGSWSMKKASETAYIQKTDSVMIFAGITPFGSPIGDVGVYGMGTIDDGMSLSYVPTSSSALTVSFGDVTFDYTDVSGYIDLVLLSQCTFDITVAGTPDTTGTATYSYFIVPYKVTADPDNPTAYKNLVSVLPLFALILLVAGAASLVYFKNKD